MIHSGSRGLGHQVRARPRAGRGKAAGAARRRPPRHCAAPRQGPRLPERPPLEIVNPPSHPQVATDALVEMERAMARDKIHVNDRWGFTSRPWPPACWLPACLLAPRSPIRRA
jgi:hypothetical protein